MQKDRNKKAKFGPRKGFSIIELLVVIAIISIMSSVFFLSHNKFKGNVLITNVAYDLALTIRQAQSYGVSVRQFDTGAVTTFGLTYGVHFDKTSSGKIILFADVDGDGFYSGKIDAGCKASDECDKELDLFRGNTIKNFCGEVSANVYQCYDFTLPGSLNPIESLDIMFQRPEPDACIRSSASSALRVIGGKRERCLPNATYGGARITVVSNTGAEKTIVISQTGQISIP